MSGAREVMNTERNEAMPELVDEVVRLVDSLTDKPSSGPVSKGVIMLKLFDQNVHPDLAETAINKALMEGRMYEPESEDAFYVI